MIEILYRKNEKPIVIFISDGCYFSEINKDEQLVYFIATAHRIQAWVRVKLGDVSFKTILSVSIPPIIAPTVRRDDVLVFRCDEMVYPSPQDFYSKIHIISEQPSSSVPNKIFIEPGLYFSQKNYHGTIISYNDKIHLIPEQDSDKLYSDIMKEGDKILRGFQTFKDPTIPYTDGKGLIELKRIKNKKKKHWWQFWIK